MKTFLSLLGVVGFALFLSISPALAGHDAASVPQDQIPWSGYWWPRSSGQLTVGYSGHPSPLEKYDSYVTGYYPAEAMQYGFEHEYDPDAYPWIGHCDDWAAASVLDPEPDHPGDILGIAFSVGDKKGLLTLNYNNNYAIVLYGSRYSGSGDDVNDIYPGGTKGFHQILLEYIKNQGLPIIMDLDATEQIWNYPAYRYDMSWSDVGNKRHVSCEVWFADDSVAPDFVGTSSFTKTFTYWLEIDQNGSIVDARGGWEGDSVNDHPDFLWFPTFLGGQSFLSDAAVEQIVDSQVTGSDDRFEENDDMSSAYPVDDLLKNRFYSARLLDQDYYKVSFSEGDDFTAFALASNDDLDLTLLDDNGEEVGTKGYHLVRLNDVLRSGSYYVYVDPSLSEGVPYQIEFFSSPSVVIPHIADSSSWKTKLTLLNTNFKDVNLRLNLFDNSGERSKSQQFAMGHDHLEDFNLNEIFSSFSPTRKWVKVLELDSGKSPSGFFSYEGYHQDAHLPLIEKGARELYLPHIPSFDNGWWVGVAILNLDAANTTQVRMEAYDKSGAVVGERSFALGANQNKVDFIQNFWDSFLPSDAAWIKFSASANIAGFFLLGNSDNAENPGLSGLPLLDSNSCDNTLYIPHVALDNGWWTGIVIINPNGKSANLTVRGYSAGGDQLATESIAIAPWANWVGHVQDLIRDWGDDMAWIEIVSNEAVAGFELSGKGMENLGAISLPTTKDQYLNMYVQHIPDKNTWWTELAFLNPNGKKADIWAEPYDQNGNRLIPDQYLWYNAPDGLGGFNNAVGAIENIFPSLPTETSYLVIHSEEPIIGFESFGDYVGHEVGMLPNARFE